MNKSSVILQFSCFKVGGLLYTLALLRVNLTGHPLIRFRPGFLLATIKSLESFDDKWFKEAILCVQEFLIGRVLVVLGLPTTKTHRDMSLTTS